RQSAVSAAVVYPLFPRRAPPPAPGLLRGRALQRSHRRAGGGHPPPLERRRVRERGAPGRDAGRGGVRQGERRGDAAAVSPAAVRIAAADGLSAPGAFGPTPPRCT